MSGVADFPGLIIAREGVQLPKQATGAGSLLSMDSSGNVVAGSPPGGGTFLAADGSAAAPSYSFATQLTIGGYRAGNLVQAWAAGGSGQVKFDYGAQQYLLNNLAAFGWTSGDPTLTVADLLLFRDAANTFAQRNGPNAQVGRWYNTFTDASNGEWLEAGWAGNVVSIQPKANGTGTQRQLQIKGSSSNVRPAAGFVGELLSSVIATGASVALATGVTSNITSITLTPGNWLVFGAVDFTFAATTSYTNLIGGVSTTSATIGAQDSFFDFETPAAVPTAGHDQTWTIPTTTFSVNVNTPVFLVAQATFTVSTLKAYGSIIAIRLP